MINKDPLVSIIIPTRNSEETIEKCLASIKSQTYSKIELIVIDNYSSDNTLILSKKYTNKVFLKKGGMAAQTNKGVFLSNGEYIAYFDDDMYLSENIIKECLYKVNQNYDAIVIPEKCSENSFWAKCRNIEKEIYKGNLDFEAARFFKKNIYTYLGGMNEKLNGYSDFDIHQKFIKSGYKIGRITDSNITHDVTPSLKEILLKRFLRAKALCEYSKIHPNHYRKILFRSVFIKSFPKIIKNNSIYGIGIYVLKSLEYFFSGLGYLVGSLKIIFKKMFYIESSKLYPLNKD